MSMNYEKEDSIRGIREMLELRLSQATASLRKIRDLHSEHLTLSVCSVCNEPYPCETFKLAIGADLYYVQKVPS